MRERVVRFLLNGAGSSAWLPRSARTALWRAVGVDIGSVVDIRPGSWLNTARLTVGKGVFINAGMKIDGFGDAFIGDDTWLAVNVTLLTSSHRIGDRTRRAGEITSAPIVIGPGCWIGAGVTILAGVSVGPGCVVGAGSLVTRDLEADGLYVGSPARLVRHL